MKYTLFLIPFAVILLSLYLSPCPACSEIAWSQAYLEQQDSLRAHAIAFPLGHGSQGDDDHTIFKDVVFNACMEAGLQHTYSGWISDNMYTFYDSAFPDAIVTKHFDFRSTQGPYLFCGDSIYGVDISIEKMGYPPAEEWIWGKSWAHFKGQKIALKAKIAVLIYKVEVKVSAFHKHLFLPPKLTYTNESVVYSGGNKKYEVIYDYSVVDKQYESLFPDSLKW